MDSDENSSNGENKQPVMAYRTPTKRGQAEPLLQPKLALSSFLPLGCITSEPGNEEFENITTLDDYHWIHVQDLSHLLSINPSIRFLTPHPDIVSAAIHRLLKAQCITIEARKSGDVILYRIYLLPDDIGRATVARGTRSLRADLEQILPAINITPEAWRGDCDPPFSHFQPWAQAEEGSLFYIFNTLPSPDPSVKSVKDPFAKEAIIDLLDYAPVPGLKTTLYPYQSRSAAAMIERESSTRLLLDPRLEKRVDPNGDIYYYLPRDLGFYRQPQMYDSQRGGILAETMGLGKTIICLAVILATKHHMPKIPPQYQKQILRPETGRLIDMCLTATGNNGVSAKLDRLKKRTGQSDDNFRTIVENHEISYLIPGKAPRNNRRSVTPPPKKLVLCSGTIIVVPRNLVHQWKAELKRHVADGPEGLKVLILDNPSAVLPSSQELRTYDVVLFSKPRFEREIKDGSDHLGRNTGNTRATCNCDLYRSSMDVMCICLREENIYRSPLKNIHWLRIIIDEGHEFSSEKSNAVLVAEKLVTAERRWVVSGTPARDRLYGVEADIITATDQWEFDNGPEQPYSPAIESMPNTPSDKWSNHSIPMHRSSTSSSIPQMKQMEALERRKQFKHQEDVGNASATKSLGLLARHFLKIKPWYQDDDQEDSKAVWEEHVFRHENFRSKTFSAFSVCLRKILQGLVIKTQPEDVERDIILPPLTHNIVRLEPSFYDKLTANMFIFVLTANAITSERTDVDYLFHKNSAKARHSLIGNLRQSNFFWTGFSIKDVESAIKTSGEYLKKPDAKYTEEDRKLLDSCTAFAEMLLKSPGWKGMSENHEIALFLDGWPVESKDVWSLNQTTNPMTIGAKQLMQAQTYLNDQLFTDNPMQGFQEAGEAAKQALIAKALEESGERLNKQTKSKTGVPSSAISHEILTSKGQLLTSPNKKSKASQGAKSTPSNKTESKDQIKDQTTAKLSKKRKLELDARELDSTHPLKAPSIIGTASAKLTYLLDRINELHKEEKIIVFYDGDNTAYYISQCLDILHIKHLIYAKTLPNDIKSRFVITFDSDTTVRVLLMDIRCGAFGLNVNKASRVFFINPVLRPATEVQAIRRAHRIGQTKPVYVETLVLNDTIEAKMFERSSKMTRTEHIEANQLSDDKGIADIIQSARLIPVDLEEGEKQMAKLREPVQIFGRPGRGDTKIKGIDQELLDDDTPKPKRAKKGSKKEETPKEVKEVVKNDDVIISAAEWMNRPFPSTPLVGNSV
jgi:hypothetical protein